jgi:CBS domain-containing protein
VITVKDLLEFKGRETYSISPDTTVYRALEIMAEKNVGALLIMQGGKLRGIFSERDYARKVILKGRHSKEIPVREIMTPEVWVVPPERTVEECMALMTDKRKRHFPVVEGDEVIGVVSIGDVVRAVISQKEFMIQQLEKYITGG